MTLVVTGLKADGVATIVRAGVPEPIAGMPGSRNETRLYWRNGAMGIAEGDDPVADGVMRIPAAGEALFLHLTFLPHSGSPVHATPTTDYVTILSGELWLVMEDGAERLLRPGDSVVQNGTPHAWENRSGDPCVMVATMIGCRAGPG